MNEIIPNPPLYSPILFRQNGFYIEKEDKIISNLPLHSPILRRQNMDICKL